MSKYDENQIEDGEVVIDLGVLLSDMWRGFKKYWGWILIILVVCVAASYLVTKLTYKPQYRSQAAFTLSTNANANYEDTYSYDYNASTAAQLANTFPYIIESSALQDIIKEDLGVEKIDAQISAQAVQNSNLFYLNVVSGDPQWSYDVLVSVMENYPKIAKYVIGDTALNVISPPVLPSGPVNALSYVKNSGLAGALGLMAGIGILLIYALRRKTIRKEEEVEEVLNLKCLCTLPQVIFKKSSNTSKLVSIHDKRVSAPYVEAVRSLRTRFQRQNGVKVIMVTSTLKGEGVSTVALNLAYSLEMDKKRVILVDADWKTPSLAKMTGTKTQGGLAEAIQTGKLEDCLSLVKGKNIGLLASAKPQKNPYSLLNSKELPMIMQRLRNGADYIIIDAGSCEESENVRLADLCDRILYVIKQDEATGAQILNALETLSYGQAEFAGVILNGVSTGFGSYGGGYGYGKYGYSKYGEGYGQTRKG